MPTKAQDELARAIANRRREIAAETRKLDAKIAGITKDMRRLAEDGTTAQKEAARVWLELMGK